MREQMKRMLSLIAVLALAGGFGCIGEDPDDPGIIDDGGKEDRWNAANDPRNFRENFEYNWEELNGQELQHGASEIIPWPDTYWPMQADGYNARWNGSALSPVELYDQAFNGWTPPEGFAELRRFENPHQEYDAMYYEQAGPATTWAHEKGGNYRARQMWNADGSMNEEIAAQCDLDDNDSVDRDAPESCDYNGDGETDMDDDWHGLEGWWGHCHAWAPAAFSAPEPQRPVTVNGVTFEIADTKALIESIYEGGGSVFLGGRCNDRDVTRDEFGRIEDVECRDTNPGAFHVVVLNVIGLLGRSFVIDATYDYQVWNQPVRDYTITQQEEIDEARACELLGRSDVTEYPYNADAERFVHVRMDFRYVVEGHATRTPYIPQIDSFTRTHRYEYILELEADGDIIGGEWVDDAPHPDFIWAPSGSSDVRAGRYWGDVVIARANVQTLIDMSTAEEEPTEPTEPTGDEHAFDAEIADPIAIPDNNAEGITSTIVVPDSLTIAALRVNVDISHSYRGDLLVSIERNGETIVLSDREGGGEDNLVANFSLDEFNGQDAAGQWILHVSDNANIDTGSLNSWRLTVSE